MRSEAVPLIARVWHGVVPAERADAYRSYLERTGLADYRATPGNRGVQVLRREADGHTHFLLITYWDSYAAIRAFAGEDLDRARYYPEDAEFLVELEERVLHYEVVGSPASAAR